MKIIEAIKKLRIVNHIRYYRKGKEFLNDPFYINAQNKDKLEHQKITSRTEVINFLLSLFHEETNYLEIGVRNPSNNFDLIKATNRYSVDPGIEHLENPVDFALTSDEFFKNLKENKILYPDIKFDVIFIDGLHLAEQVDRDIKNALNYIKDNGFIVIHDCNPPTEWHTRIAYNYYNTPAYLSWNGTTWKAFLKWRMDPNVQSCCINSDWGVGILSKNRKIGENLKKSNPFYEYNLFEANRVEYLNLMDFEYFKKLIK